MSITVQSTSDSPEAVIAANSDLAKATEKPVSEAVSAVADEKNEASESSEAEVGMDADQAEESDEESTEQESEESLEKPKKNSGFKKKISKLTRKLSEKDQQIAYWQNEAQKKSQVEAKDAAKVVETKSDSKAGKPKADAFNSHEEYVEALTDWKVDQKDAAKEAKLKDEKLKTEQQKQVETYHSRVNEFKKTEQPNFTEKVVEFFEDNEDIKNSFSLAVSGAIQASEIGPAIMFELIKNPNEFRRINNLSYGDARHAIGKIEARLEKQSDSSKTTETKTSKAPAPIKPIGSKGSASAKKDIYDPNLSQRDFEKAREEQLKARRA